MSLMQQRQHAGTPIQGWLQDVQRDPRSVGAFRRRIQCLLQDPAVARRVAGRLDRRFGDDRLGDERLGGPERPAATDAPRCGSELSVGLSAPFAGPFAGSSGPALNGSLIGRCDCEKPCVLMTPDLRRFDTLAPRLKPVAVQFRA